MNEQLDHLPCGILELTKIGEIISANQRLLEMVNYYSDELAGQHINKLFPASTRIFFQLYFMPLITVKERVEEMYLTIVRKNDEQLPVLINATLKNEKITCVIIPMLRRSEFESQILSSKRQAEDAMEEKARAVSNLENALGELGKKQGEILEINDLNQQYKTDTTKELQLAKIIQETSLPSSTATDKIEFESFFEASNELSGDIFGFYPMNDYQYGIIIIDVMGHGISPALITMSMQSLFQKLISTGATAEQIMAELDSHLHHLSENNSDAWHYCTAIYLCIDTKKETIDYINAGHPPAIFQQPNGEQQELFSKAPPIGTFENILFKKTTLNYSEGSRLLLYTDGVSERFQPMRLNSLMAENAPLSAVECKEKILSALETEGTDARKSDDQCFIIVDLK